MAENFVNTIIELYKEKNWKEIIQFHEYPERNKLLWVFPSKENLVFIQACLEEIRCSGIISIGCGSGLLEWLIMEATGIPVSGVEIDGAWWRCKYAPPTFIPLLFTSSTLDKDTKQMLETSKSSALMFCYFNNRPAFDKYLKHFAGKTIIIIGPHGKGVHTDPKPFDNVDENWTLFKWQEVRNSKDFIAIYCKN